MTTRLRTRGGASALGAVLALSMLAPVATAQSADVASDLYISEYVEGSSNNKALELANDTGSPIDLSAYDLVGYHNGASTPTYTISLVGSLPDGEVFVLASSEASAAILAEADQTTGTGLWNGDDALVVRRGSAVVDSFGRVGEDPGNGWGSGDTFTRDNTLRRMADVCAGDTEPGDPFDPGDEYDGYAVDTFDGLGTHTSTCDDGSGGDDVDAVINEFSASTTGDDVEYVEVLGDADTDLSRLRVLQVEGDASSSNFGLVMGDDAVGTTDGAGLYLVDPPDTALQNGTMTLLLVQDWTGETDADGDLGTVVDSVAVNDGGAGDVTWGPVELGPNYDGVSNFAPGGASRIPDGTDTDTPADWVRNDFDLAGIGATPGTPVPGEAFNTPGAANAVVEGSGGDDPVPAFVHDVQDGGALFPVPPEVVVEVQAVVTSLFEANDTLDGFFVQEEDADADVDPATSEGLFVFCRGFCPGDLAVGDQVTVTGVMDEFFGTTQLEPADGDAITVDASGVALPQATEIDLPASGSTVAEDTFESTESMVVTFADTLAVSEYFQLARFGQLVLTAEERPYQYTHDNAPSVAGYAAFLDDLATRRIILDDDNNDNNDAIEGPDADEAYPYPSASWPDGGLSLADTIRGGDTIDDLTGVLHWSFAGGSDTNAWRVRPIDGFDYTFDRVNVRTDAPADVGGRLTVASFNVLNYFTSIDGVGTCQAGCRGADSVAEFERQQDKIVAALAAIDADVLGLIEIENNDSAVADLAKAVNAVVGADTYAPVETGVIGGDSIKVGFLYKPATVELAGDHAILDSSVDPTFVDTENRPALAQSFREVQTDATFTAAVNHLKSKGSDCADLEDESVVDGQANCSQTRTDAAIALANWLASDPTGSGDSDALILGDLNAYRMEDAVVALEDAGYTDLNEAYGGDDTFTYLFDGQLGYLDYALTNPSLTGQVTGVTQWHVNADEVPLLDYNDAIRDPAEASFERESDALPIYAPDPFRSSDHDPVVVGLDLDVPAPDYPAWDPTVRYQTGDVVRHDGLLWEAIRRNRNREPGVRRGPWQLFNVDYTLTVLHNNDGESDLLGDDDGAGSISRFAWLVEQLQRDAVRKSYVTRVPSGQVTISAGDNFLASPEWQASLDKGVPFFDATALDHLDYDAFTIGNHEFDFGPDILADFVRSFRGDDDIFVSANLDFSQEPALQELVDAGRIRPSVVVEERGERIGIIGATTPDLAEVTSPGDVVVDPDLVTVVQGEVDRMTADGVDKILVSSHLQDISNELALIGELTDVDAVIGGGGGEDIRDNYPLVARDADGDQVPVVTVPGDYFDVGELELHFDAVGELVAWGGGLVPVTGDLRQDPYVLRRIEQPVEAYLSDLAETVVATSQVGLNGVRGDVRTRETNVGNLMTDGMLATATELATDFGVPEPDIALQNGGGIRNDSVIPAGPISLLDTFDIAPFTNFVAVLPDVARSDVVAAVEHGLAGLPGAAGSFAQWGGLVVTYDPAAAAGSRVVDLTLADGTPIVQAGVLVDGDPLTIATIDFLAAGNDGYDMFESYDFTRVGVSYQQSLANHLRSLGTVTAADYADPVDPADRERIIPVG